MMISIGGKYSNRNTVPGDFFQTQVRTNELCCSCWRRGVGLCLILYLRWSPLIFGVVPRGPVSFCGERHHVSCVYVCVVVVFGCAVLSYIRCVLWCIMSLRLFCLAGVVYSSYWFSSMCRWDYSSLPRAARYLVLVRDTPLTALTALTALTTKRRR